MSESIHDSTNAPDPRAGTVGHPPRCIVIGPETHKREIAPLLADFRELVQAHDCPTAELQLDLLIGSCRDLAREVGVLDAEIAALTEENTRLRAIVAHQERTIARLRVEGSARPRSALERVVDYLGTTPRDRGGWQP